MSESKSVMRRKAIQVTHSEQSVWDEMVEAACAERWHSHSFRQGTQFAEIKCKHIPKVKKLLDAVKAILEITDRKHVTWDKAKEALKDFE